MAERRISVVANRLARAGGAQTSAVERMDSGTWVPEMRLISRVSGAETWDENER
jgi:hypothetical protein